jgi:hypothetical protein
MADQQSTEQGNAAPTGRPFADMSASEKVVWLRADLPSPIFL